MLLSVEILCGSNTVKKKKRNPMWKEVKPGSDKNKKEEMGGKGRIVSILHLRKQKILLTQFRNIERGNLFQKGKEMIIFLISLFLLR